MSGRTDYYAALGVSEKASQEEIKRAYRKLARKVHPDVNPGDAKAEDRFKEISEAYHVLGDAERRKQYDRVGPEVFAQEFDLSDFGQQFGRFFHGARGAPAASGGTGWLEDLLGGANSPFGGAGVPRPQRGRDVQTALQMSLLDAIRGTERSLNYQSVAGGPAQRARVKVPAGVRDGSRIRLRGKGEPGLNGGPSGDLFLEVKLIPHPTLELSGDDLITELPVTVYDAALGGRVDVPTLDGTTTINLPAGTRSGQRMRLSGKGAPRRAGDGTGDLIVRIRVQMPEVIDPGLEKLFRRIRDEHPYDPRGEGGD